MTPAYIAVDFGGGSGRVIAGTVADGRVTLDEVHRFGNRQRRLGGQIYWDFLSLFDDMIVGLGNAVQKGYRILSVGIDTWGVDFGLIDAQGNLLSNPVCYRSPGVDGTLADFCRDVMSEEELYAQAGIQAMDINSLFRLVRMKKTAPALLGAAWRLLFMPDLFSFFLTGEANNEYTIASTSELIDPNTHDWNRSLIERAGLPADIFGPVVTPGMVRGYLTEDVCRQIGVDYQVPVIAVGSHDTASAVYAVQESNGDTGTAYLSSGTWSLLGVLSDTPVLTEAARLGGFTNEGGVGGKIRLLQNITGLWILQRLMAEWEAMGLDVDYDHMLGNAANADIDTVIDVDDDTFASPSNMGEAISSWCSDRGLRAPQGQGETVRVVLQSLADRYRRGIEGLNALLPEPVTRLQIIGGGSRNQLLNRLTAEATGLEIVAGPVEATAVGNILCQAKASPSQND